MRCIGCRSETVTERPERSTTLLNRTQYRSDVIALVVPWRLPYKLALRDLSKMLAVYGMVFSHEAVREREAELTPALAEEPRRYRRGKVAAAGTSMRCTSRSAAAGATSIARSTAPARPYRPSQAAPSPKDRGHTGHPGSRLTAYRPRFGTGDTC